jgi:hypothetical protein
MILDDHCKFATKFRPVWPRLWNSVTINYVDGIGKTSRILWSVIKHKISFAKRMDNDKYNVIRRGATTKNELRNLIFATTTDGRPSLVNVYGFFRLIFQSDVVPELSDSIVYDF